MANHELRADGDSVQWAGFLLDRLVAPKCSALTNCLAPEIPELPNYFGSFFLNNIFIAKASDKTRSLTIVFLRRLTNAVRDYRNGREEMLACVAARTCSNNMVRASRPDLAQVVRKLWLAHEGNVDARPFLLRVIWLGETKECADLPARVAFGALTDRYTGIYAGRALMATADDATKARYAAHVKAHCAALPKVIVWDTLEELFPRYLTIDDLLAILALVDVADRDGGLGLDWHGPKLMERLSSQADLERLIQELLIQLGGTVAAGVRDTTDREKAYFPMIAAAADRLLELCPVDQAPVVAIDAAARLGESARTSRSARKVSGGVIAELQRTSARRRRAFWHFAERLAGHRMLGGGPIESISAMQMLGWSINLSVDDIDWLLTDGPKRETDHERRLAISTALVIWRDAGKSDNLQERIAVVAKTEPVMAQYFDAWFMPRVRSPAEMKSEKELERLQRRNAVERAARDKSWVDFAAKLRANPDEMRAARNTRTEPM